MRRGVSLPRLAPARPDWAEQITAGSITLLIEPRFFCLYGVGACICPKPFAKLCCLPGRQSLLYASIARPFHPPLAQRKILGICVSCARLVSPCLIERNPYSSGFFPISIIRHRTHFSNQLCRVTRIGVINIGPGPLLSSTSFSVSLIGQHSS